MDNREPVCSWLVDNFGDALREVMELTEESGHEHGFTVIGTPDNMEPTSIVSGSEQSISITSQTTTAFRPVRVGVHTHPSGSIVPSNADWRSFLTEHSQYRPEADWPDGWRHAMVILGRRLGEDDSFGMKALELTDAGIGLDINEQREWVQHGLSVLNDEPVGTLGTTEDIADAIGPQVRVCTRTVEVAR